MENIQLYSDIRMTEYAKTVLDFRLPRWEQIPTLGLYMDQVVTVIDQALSPLIGFNEDALITPSMINNYVKLGIIKKPEKKKYNREHIACLIVITILKQAASIADIRLGIDASLKYYDMQSSYDSFCDYVERSVKIVAKSVTCSDKNVKLNFEFNSEHSLITMAVCSFATKTVTAKMVSVIRQDIEKQSEKAEDKNE